MSSAEQSRIAHSLAKVGKDGYILPDKYCDNVGFDTPSSFAIWLFDLPDSTISSLRFLDNSSILAYFIIIV